MAQILKKKIYLSGSSGQIGSELRELFYDEGIPLCLMCRQPLSDLKANETIERYELGDSFRFPDTNAELILIHLAHDFLDRKEVSQNVNYQGLKQLLKSLQNHKLVKVIFLSTPTLNRHPHSLYQELKLACESLLVDDDCLILKPSLVFSQDKGINRLINYYGKTGLPLFLPSQSARIAPLSSRDLAILICELLSKDTTGEFLIAGKKKMTFQTHLLMHHGMKSFYLPNIFVKLILKICNLFPDNTVLFNLSERINGFLFLTDIDDLSSQTESFIV